MVVVGVGEKAAVEAGLEKLGLTPTETWSPADLF
jgi:hypothetical protein